MLKCKETEDSNMAAAYSYDLRIKVMKYLEGRNTVKETSKIFNISRKTIIEWKKLKKSSGDVKAKSGYQKGHSHIIKDLATFKKLIEENKDKTAKEIAELWDKPVSARTVLRALDKLDYTYKKNFYSP